MPDCTLVGIVQNITGTGQARTGTRLSVKQSQLPSGLMAHETRRLDFYVTADGTLATAVTDGEPATIEQGAYILFEGPVYAFNLGRNWVQIPEAAEVDINQLAEDAAAAPDPPASVSTSTFNTHIQKLANPDDAGHITNVGAGLSLADGMISLGDLDATFATDAALTAEAAARAAADALLQPTSEKNQANGYVGLDGSGLIADIRIPASIARDSEVTSAIAALSTVYQPLNANLTTIAGLSPSASDVLQFVGGAWANRTPAQLKTSLSLAQADISGLTTASSPAFAGLTLTGPVLGPNGAAGTPTYAFPNTLGFFSPIVHTIGVTVNGTERINFNGNGIDMGTRNIAWGSALRTNDLFLERDAANTLALRNGANAQALRVYGTYTDASNYERANIGFVTDAVYGTSPFKVQTANAGTGSARRLVLESAGILHFASEATARWAISSGHLLASTDNAYDIGASGATRPRRVYLGTSLVGPNGSLFTDGGGNGIWTLYNSAANGYDRLQFGGITASFPALKRSATVLQGRLADDSDFCPVQGRLRVHANAVAETPTATHTLRIFDAAGVEYKVLCVAA